MMLQRNSKTISFPFDDIFHDHREYIDHLIKVYQEIYRLPILRHEQSISDELMKYVGSRRHFVLLSLYDHDKRIFLYREMAPDLGWAIPGGSILAKEELFEAINRHAQKISREIQLGEIEPICIVNNVFNHGGRVCEHFGIAFNTRVRNPSCVTGMEIPGSFVRISESELQRISRYANREVVTRCYARLRQFELPVAENEVAASETLGVRYSFHNNFVKRFVLTDRRKKKTDLNSKFDAYVRDARNIIDPSCGDSSFLQSLVERNASIQIAVANDIAWETTKFIRMNSPKIIFTNHDAIYLPFEQDTFDVAVCSNTLHHMPSSDKMRALLETLFRVARRVVLYEIENPAVTGGFPKLLNQYYYHQFLHDQGIAYLTNEQFKSLVTTLFSDRAVIEFDEFRNLQGRYMIAVVDKKQFSHLEAEDKRELSTEKESDLLMWLRSHGFRSSVPSKEVDEYFSDIGGQYILNRTCLRIRDSEQNGQMTVDFKEGTKAHEFGSSFAKQEYNLSLNRVEARTAREVLSHMGFLPYVKVVKERTVWERVEKKFFRRVCIDQVDERLKFAEFELVTQDNTVTKGDLMDALNKFVDEVGFSDAPKAHKPYRDIVAERRRKLLNPNDAKVVMFDLDGTIVPTEKLFFETWKAISKSKFAVDVSFEDYIRYELEQDGALFHYLSSEGKFAKSISIDEYMTEIYEAYEVALSERIHIGEFRESFAPIKSLEGRYRIGLVTTSKREFVEPILTSAREKPNFEVVICREDVERRKPDPAAYLKAMSLMQVSPQEVIAIEDSKRGALAATAAGIHSLLINNEALQLNGWSKQLSLPMCETLEECCLLLIE